VHECDDLTEARAVGVARVHVDLRCVQPDPFETVMDRGMRLTIGEVGIALPEHAAVQVIAAARQSGSTSSVISSMSDRRSGDRHLQSSAIHRRCGSVSLRNEVAE
jgi:hypothetical protein